MPMRQLRTCDFCGDDAAGVYEVLPPELSPTEAEQRRVVLCADCLETLEGVLDPLLARLGVGRSDEHGPDRPVTPAASSGAPDSSESTPALDSQSPADTAAADTAVADSSESVDTGAAPETDTGTDTEAEVDIDGETDMDSETETDTDADADTESPTGADPDSDDASWEDARSPPPLGESEESAPSMPDAASNGTAEADASSPPESSSEAPERASGPSTTDEEPEEFRTVMRLLGNREFPIPRAEIVELAAGAYDLEESHVEQIIEYAVDRDLLVDDSGTLRKA
ncbi:hypothetical protein D3D02_04405 [Halobellus sp. Atlit-38R]|uniref:hypothetical protein n=1 Tax=Halobellus sp. Atlit-38R TaxID=2282131 RepID=UPI000EF18770|nr:hypothetical protein [Halobellus sp. Atlit-38R]RLM91005.1 hypothetical protein D3D02_04405 [Halobellus sp. Atlit-38R]